LVLLRGEQQPVALVIAGGEPGMAVDHFDAAALLDGVLVELVDRHDPAGNGIAVRRVPVHDVVEILIGQLVVVHGLESAVRRGARAHKATPEREPAGREQNQHARGLMHGRRLHDRSPPEDVFAEELSAAGGILAIRTKPVAIMQMHYADRTYGMAPGEGSAVEGSFNRLMTSSGETISSAE